VELLKKPQTNPTDKKVYEDAIREFVKDTIHHPRFFDLTSEQQKEQAMQVLNKHKKDK